MGFDVFEKSGFLIVLFVFLIFHPMIDFQILKTAFVRQNAIKFCLVNKLNILNGFVFHNSHRNITHSALITRPYEGKLCILLVIGVFHNRDALFILFGSYILFDCSDFFYHG